MRSAASFTRPASATTYTEGDAIANSATGSSVTPMTFKLGLPRTVLMGGTCVVTPASGSLVITALDFDLLLFRPNTDIPFAAGSFPADNAAMTLTAAAYRDLVGILSFSAGTWRNPLGAFTAAATGWQDAAFYPRPAVASHTLDQDYLVGVVQVTSAWDPGNVANQFDFVLDGTYE